MADEMMAQPGLAEGQAPGAAPVEGGDAAQQLRDLVGGVQQGMSLVRSIMEATPGAPDEAKGLLDSANESFMQAMQLMVHTGDDEAAAEPEVATQEQALAGKPQFVPKTPGTL
jgi:hypothetical protein